MSLLDGNVASQRRRRVLILNGLERARAPSQDLRSLSRQPDEASSSGPRGARPRASRRRHPGPRRCRRLPDAGGGPRRRRLDELQQVAGAIVATRHDADRDLPRVSSTFRAGVPQLYVDIDRDKAKTPGRAARPGLHHAAGEPRLERTSTTSTSSAAPTRSASRPTRSSALTPRRHRPAEVRNRHGDMIPLGTLATVDAVVRPAADQPLQPVPVGRRSPAQPAPGVSSGEALALMEEIAAKTLPPGMGYRMDRHVVPGEGSVGGQIYSSSPWRCCWSTWCWPPSTRAGSRRSR